jgi:hypothetical protein
MKIYCAKCKTKKETNSNDEVYVAEPSPIVMGRCPGCGRKIYRITGKKKR